MTRRTLGTGPTEGEPTVETTGARLLPVERLSGPQDGREAVESEQRPQMPVQRPARRVLGLPSGYVEGALDTSA
ncbi:hypothetical protein ACFWJ5_41695 [Streptomyces qaidamensis]|uniref:hypothetical protein n=1 Tax=Streptomyces qaidamensis TaxID=1783515 RepID=UPI00364B1D2B